MQIMGSFRKSYFQVSYRRRVSGILARQQPCLGDAGQGGEMASLFNLLFFVFNISFLPNYRDKYYDFIVKWCNGAACNCISLDIALILARGSH